MNNKNARKSAYSIADIFTNRWSQRAMSGEAMSYAELMPLFEAARWAPSSYNNQPWRFIYAHRDTPAWNKFFDLLMPGNQVWAKNAGALILVLSKKFSEHDQSPLLTNSFDTGSAWMSLALQGAINNLAVRAIAGFDYDKARAILHIPDEFKIEIMIAVGKPGDKSALPAELQARETPSNRKPLAEIVFANEFK